MSVQILGVGSASIERLLNVFFCSCGLLLLIEAALFGSGISIPGVPFAIRRALFLLLLLAAFALRLASPRSFTRADVALICTILVFIAVWVVVIPSAYGFSLNDALADASPWAILLILAVWPWSSWCDADTWSRVRRIVTALGLILALIHVVLWVLLTSELVSSTAISFSTALLLRGDSMGESSVRIALSSLGYRVYWSSSIFLMGCLYFVLAYRSRPITLRWALMIALVLLALWSTQIRAFLGALLLSAVLLPLAHALTRRELIPSGGLILSFWLSAVLIASLAINPELLSLLGVARDSVGDLERVEQSGPLLMQFLERPLLGNGFGSYVPELTRSLDSPFSYELTFHALMMKLGIAGVAILTTMLYLALRIVNADRFARYEPRAFAFWLAFTTGLWFAGATNPLVTNFVGMLVMVLLLADLKLRDAAIVRAFGRKPQQVL